MAINSIPIINPSSEDVLVETNNAILAMEMVDPFAIGIKLPVNDHNWDLLFRYYNQNHEKQLGKSCRLCYLKVWNFVRGVRNA